MMIAVNGDGCKLVLTLRLPCGWSMGKTVTVKSDAKGDVPSVRIRVRVSASDKLDNIIWYLQRPRKWRSQ